MSKFHNLEFVPKIKSLLQGREARFVWIPREENSEADMLSRMAYRRYRERKGKISEVVGRKEDKEEKE